MQRASGTLQNSDPREKEEEQEEEKDFSKPPPPFALRATEDTPPLSQPRYHNLPHQPNHTTTTMPLITPFIPTAEELAECERLHGSRPLPQGGSATHTPTHTLSTGVPPAAAAHTTPQAFHGSAYGTHAPAYAIPGQPQPPQQQPRPSLVPCIITAAQLSRMVIPRRPALLDRWLCQGDLGYIFAPRGVGKTWMAMALPSAISRRLPLGLWQAGDAAPVFEESTPSPAESPAHDAAAEGPEGEDPAPDPSHVPVLYVDGEMNLNHTQYRSDGLCMPLGHVCFLHHEHLFEIQTRSLNLGEIEDRQCLTDAIVQKGYKVVILDNLSSLACGIDENKGSDYEPLSHWLLELRRRKITVIVIHHAGRNGFMRGHSKREDACSWILELRDARQDSDPGARFVSHFAKPSRNTGEPLPDLLWHFTSDEKGNTEVKCELAANSEYEQFIQHVCEGVTSQKDIAEMMNRHKGTISKWARKALEEGRISGNSHKLVPPRFTDSTPVKSHYHPDEDEGDEEEEDL